MTPERGAPASRSTMALPVLGAVLVLAVLALAVLAAGGGRWASPPASATSAPTTAPSASPPPPPPAAGETSPPGKVRRDSRAESVTAYLVFGLVLVLVLVGLVLLAGLAHRPVWRRWTRRHRTAGRTVEAAGPEAGDGALPAAVHRALRAVADQPDAREAVVQAWLFLCEAAAAAGTPIRPAETATEYARRLATAHHLPTASVERLAGLYREARFSEHPVQPEQREAARSELQTLRSALTVAPEQASR